MQQAYLELLNDTFSDPSKLTLENLKSFVDETVKFFSEIKEDLASKDPDVQEGALSTSNAVRRLLEDKMDGLCKLTGLDPAQLSMMSENPNNMNSDEYNLIKDAKNQFSSVIDDGNSNKSRSKLRHNILKSK